jgi:hypothetical protein
MVRMAHRLKLFSRVSRVAAVRHLFESARPILPPTDSQWINVLLGRLACLARAAQSVDADKHQPQNVVQPGRIG